MLDATIKVTKKEASEYPALPENVYQVELLDITSEVRPTYDTRNKPANEQVKETIMSFQFTLLGGKDEEGKSLRVRNVWANFVPVYLYIGKNGKNTLYKIVEALIGRKLSIEEEANGIDGAYLNALIGKQCRLGIKNKQVKDKTYDRIEQYYPSEADLPALTEEEKETVRVKVKEPKIEEGEAPLADIPF